MLIKKTERLNAIALRKQGKSYNEILREIPVAKSTLSVWLKDVGLAKQQKQRLTEKRIAAQRKAQLACRNTRIAREKKTIEAARKEVGRITQRELWLIGTALYWAEGSKQKANLVSQKVCFSNSDPKMILLFDKWMKQICKRTDEDVVYSLYIHPTGNVKRAQHFWGELLGTKIDRVYFKKHHPKTKRYNTTDGYFGLLRVEVRKSTDLNRTITGWTLGICENY